MGGHYLVAEVFNVGCFVTSIASVAKAKVDLFYRHASSFDVPLLNPSRMTAPGREPKADLAKVCASFFFFFFWGGT